MLVEMDMDREMEHFNLLRQIHTSNRDRIRELEDALHLIDCPVEFVPTQDEQGGCVHCGAGTVVRLASEKEHDEDCAWRVAHNLLAGVFCPNCGVRKGTTHVEGVYFDIRSKQAKAVGCRPGNVFE